MCSCKGFHLLPPFPQPGKHRLQNGMCQLRLHQLTTSTSATSVRCDPWVLRHFLLGWVGWKVIPGFIWRMWTFVVCICLCGYLVLLWFHTRRNKSNSWVNLCRHHILPRSESSNPWGHDNAPHPETTNLGSSWSCFQNWACWWINHLDLSWVFCCLKNALQGFFKKKSHHFSTANKQNTTTHHPISQG